MNNIITAITGVWTAIMEWFADSIAIVESLFYNAETGLTLLGTLSIVALAIAIFMLIFNIVRGFLGLRK